MPTSPHVSTVAYDDLQPLRAALLEKMTQVVRSGSGGPELMQIKLAALTPEDLGLRDRNANSVLIRFQVSLLTQGSGTQLLVPYSSSGARVSSPPRAANHFARSLHTPPSPAAHERFA